MNQEKTILIVDDQNYNIEVIIDTLQTSIFKFNIYRANNAKLALEIAKKKTPDIIITDWDMPEMSGIELIEELKKDDTTKDIPVIIFSGIMITSDNLQTALKAGAFDYIRKPIDKIELEARVFSALRHSDTLSTLKNERKQFLSILDSIPEIIYVADLNTHEILFANKHLKNTIGHDITGEACYRAIQDKTDVCDFCTNKYIKDTNESHFWEYFNPVLDKQFYIMDRKIKWTDQKEVRFELAIDITMRKKAEEKLKKSKDELRIAFESANIGIMNVDKTAKILYANEECTKIFGYSKEELKTMTVNDMTAPEDKNVSPRFIQSALKDNTHEKAVFEKRYYHKKGDIITCEISSTLLHNANNEPLYFISHIKDITKQKQAEENLRKSKEKYRLITENASDVIWVLNLSLKKFTYISPSVYNLRGYTAEEAMQQDIDQSLTPESAKIVTDSISEILPQFLENPGEMNKEIFRHELRQPCKDGSIIWIETTTRYQFNPDNEVEVIGISRNIDKRKKQEERIASRLHYEENLSKFSSSLLVNQADAINKSLYYLLKASDCSRVYIFENFTDKENQLYMKQTHEICDKGIEPQIHNPQLQEVNYERDGFARWKKILSQGEYIKGMVNDFPSGEKELLQAQDIKSILVIPIYIAGKWSGFIGFDDVKQERQWKQEDVKLLITASEIIGLFIEKKQQEEEVKNQNTELQKLNATKDKFFSIIAHDLKNPFTTLLGMSESLMKNYEQYPDEKRKEQIQAIGDSSKKTFKLLETLLVWSRTQTGRIKFNPQEIALDDLITENIQLFSNVAKAKNISLEKDTTNEIFVKGDYEMLNTVIRNLLSNAIKFTPEGGKVKVGSKNENKDEVLCYVKDTGIGITPENKKKLFRVDQNFSCKGTNQEKGTGLGLILSKEFIEKHGGEIGVESKPKEGTTFHFTLKKVKKQEISMDDCFPNPKKLIQDIYKSEEIKNEFINKIIPVFKETNGKYSAKGIKRFFCIVKDFGKKHNIPPLTEFAIRIEEYMESFDIPKINACFKEFEKTLTPRSG